MHLSNNASHNNSISYIISTVQILSFHSRVRVQQPECLKQSLNVPSKLLMGPGPSNSPQRVHQAMLMPLLGHLHPEFIQVR